MLNTPHDSQLHLSLFNPLPFPMAKGTNKSRPLLACKFFPVKRLDTLQRKQLYKYIFCFFISAMSNIQDNKIKFASFLCNS